MASFFSGSKKRLGLLSSVVPALRVSIACQKSEAPAPIIVHVLRDSSAPFAKNLRQADLQFGLSKARVNSGKWIMIATNEGNSYPILVRRLADAQEDLLILNSPSGLPDSAAVRDHVGKLEFVCGGARAYIPDWASGEQREAAGMYLRFIVAHCEASRAL
jgi:hypothetical protein